MTLPLLSAVRWSTGKNRVLCRFWATTKVTGGLYGSLLMRPSSLQAAMICSQQQSISPGQLCSVHVHTPS